MFKLFDLLLYRDRCTLKVYEAFFSSRNTFLLDDLISGSYMLKKANPDIRLVVECE